MGEVDNRGLKEINQIVRTTCDEFGFSVSSLTADGYSNVRLKPLRVMLAQRLKGIATVEKIAKVLGCSKGSVSYYQNLNKPKTQQKPTVKTVIEKPANLNLNGFVRFIKSQSIRKTPAISTYKTLRINFNKSAQNQYNLKDFKSVIYHFDPDNRIIGIEFLKKGNDISFTIYESKYNLSVHCGSFMKCYKIKPFSAIPLERTDKENFYTAKLEE